MTGFERAFGDTEKAANSTMKSAAELAKLAGVLRNAAKKGDIGAIKKAVSRLNSALSSLRQEVENAVETWPFKDGDEAEYLREHFAAELHGAAAEKGLNIYERDGVLISHPSIVQILPENHAVRIDRKKVSTLRPSYLADILINNQKKPRRFRSDRFLEALYNNYKLCAKLSSSGSIKDPVVPLEEIYKTFTSLPGVSNDYKKLDFAKDLYFLEVNGPFSTRSGARVAFPSSTLARSARGSFPIVGPDGQIVTYYGIQFIGGE
jgi:hypothetical protein